MKKIFALVLTALCLLSLVACGSELPQSSAPTHGGGQSAKPSTSTTEKPTVPQGELFQKAAVINETVLYDENNVRIIATKLEYLSNTVRVHLLFENNTDVSLSFVSGSMVYCCNSLNGYMMYSAFVNCEVAAGKKAYDTISFKYDELMMHGLTAVADFELAFHIFDDNDTVEIYTGPCVLKTSVAETYEYNDLSLRQAIMNPVMQQVCNFETSYWNEEVIYNENGITIESAGVLKIKDDIIFAAEVVNHSEEQINFALYDISINGVQISSGKWDSDTVNAGKRGLFTVKLTSAWNEELWDPMGFGEVTAVSASVVLEDINYKKLTEKSNIEVVNGHSELNVNKTGAQVYNQNGVTIIYKGIVEDASEYSDDLYVLLLVENLSGKEIEVDEKYNSLSINGVMASSYSFYDKTVSNGEYGALKLTIFGSTLEKNNITGIADISDIEITLQISDSDDHEEEPTISISCK